MVKSPLTNVLLGLDAVAVPFVVIVTAESQVERCVINLLFQTVSTAETAGWPRDFPTGKADFRRNHWVYSKKI